MLKKVKLPYGIGHFPTLIYDGYVYVDKTRYIEVMEDLSTLYHFFLRPRRFGKSLFVSVLTHYYDVKEKDNFEKLFGNLYIGKNPTPKKNSYWVLNFEFSRIDTTTLESTYSGFLDNVKKSVEQFLIKYNIAQNFHDKILNNETPHGILSGLFSVCANLSDKYPIYLIIDEYDHFANEILAFHQNSFSGIVGRNGFVRKFYETIKTGAMEGIVGRFFATGVTPITLDSLTSGFNITTDLSRDLLFNECMGFNFEEVKHLVDLVCQQQDCDKSKMFEDMKNWYNGYLFNIKAKNRVYNSDMVLYFLNKLNVYQQYPDNLLDVNIASDYGKVARFFKIGDETKNLLILQKLVEHKEISSKITDKFNFERNFLGEDLISLLYYMGFLTIKSSDLSGYFFRMPNYVIETLYFDFFVHYLQNKVGNDWFDNVELQDAIRALALKGEPKLLADELQKAMQKLSGRDAIKFGEKNIKVILVTLLNYSKAYYVKSEYEVDKKYVDVLLLKRPPIEVKYQYAIELKYLAKKDEKQKEAVKQEAITQLKGYLQNEELQKAENLKAIVLVFVGEEYEMIEVQ